MTAGQAVGDPLWRMPFWTPYDKQLKSAVADVSHIAEGLVRRLGDRRAVPQALRRNAKRFAHLDIFGWVPAEQPGRPKGGEPQAPARCSLLSAKDSKDRDRRRRARSAPPRLSRRLAAVEPLRGRVAARRFVTGEPRQVAAPSLPLRREPRFDADARHRGAARRGRDRL